jgi:large subunit ribosomal protein L10
MDRTGKAQVTAEVAQALADSKVVVLTDFTGITVEEVTRLRNQIRAKKGKFRVAKNTLAARAFASDDHAEFRKLFKGPNALAFSHDDPVGVLKVLSDFEASSNGKIKIRGGLLEGKFTSSADLKAIAKLPPREVMLAMVVGLAASPLQRLLTVLSGTTRKFLYGLKALQEKKAKDAPETPEAPPAPETPETPAS